MNPHGSPSAPELFSTSGALLHTFNELKTNFPHFTKVLFNSSGTYALLPFAWHTEKLYFINLINGKALLLWESFGKSKINFYEHNLISQLRKNDFGEGTEVTLWRIAPGAVNQYDENPLYLLHTFKPINAKTTKGFPVSISQFKMAPNGQLYAIMYSNGTIATSDLKKQITIAEIKYPQQHTVSHNLENILEFSPDNFRLFIHIDGSPGDLWMLPWELSRETLEKLSLEDVMILMQVKENGKKLLQDPFYKKYFDELCARLSAKKQVHLRNYYKQMPMESSASRMEQ